MTLIYLPVRRDLLRLNHRIGSTEIMLNRASKETLRQILLFAGVVASINTRSIPANAIVNYCPRRILIQDIPHCCGHYESLTVP